MMIVDPFTAQLQSAVLAYFAGERQELWLTLDLSLLVSVLVTCLWLSTRTGFAAALALTTVVATGLLAGGAVAQGVDQHRPWSRRHGGAEIARHPTWQNFLHRLYGRGQEHCMG